MDTDIQKILTAVPGLYMRTEEGYGLRPNISIRGTAIERSGKVTIMEDGVLVAPSPYTSSSAYYFPTTGRIHSVEVLKGPAAVSQGPQTIGGAINLISTPIPNAPSGKFVQELGENGMMRTHAYYGGTSGNFGALVEVHEHESDGFDSIANVGGDTGFDKSDLIFCLDFNNRKRVGINLSPYLFKSSNKHIIVIDHHRNPENFGDSEIIDTDASSTCELVFNLIKSNGDIDLIDIPIAESIYIGLITDTGSFKYSSVSSSTHLIASKLEEIGLNHVAIHNNIFDQNSVSKINLLGYALQKIKLDPNTSLAYLVLSKEELEKFNFQKGDSEGFVNYCLSIKGVKNAVFLREDKSLIKISFRSKGDVKMNEFSHKYYGGGGHQNAAGAAVESNDIDIVTKTLIENFRSFCSV